MQDYMTFILFSSKIFAWNIFHSQKYIVSYIQDVYANTLISSYKIVWCKWRLSWQFQEHLFITSQVSVYIQLDESDKWAPLYF